MRTLTPRLPILVWAVIGLATPVAAQIVDRPPAEPRGQSSWGIAAGITPQWQTVDAWSSFFFEEELRDESPLMDGRDIRLSVVRGRPLGREFGISYVRKTINKGLKLQGRPFWGAVEYTSDTDIQISGIETHVVLPFKRFGRRAQLGVLLGGGLGALPEATIRKKVTGPPFYATCTGTALGASSTTQPANGGFLYDTTCLPLAPGNPSATTSATMWEISPTDQVWLLARAQLAADIILATPAKLRFTGGFNFPGAQWFGVDFIYFFQARR